MPLLVGLLDSSARRNLDIAIPLHTSTGQTDTELALDLEDLAAKANAGGGMVDSIANMANSILGAGICFFSPFLGYI